MLDFETTVTEKGQVTIPQEIRRKMGLHPRDKVRFVVVDNIIHIEKATSKILASFGAAARFAPIIPHPQAEQWQAEREAFEEGVAEEVISEA
jgi:AbrB family looped-hinge helix DNA binding protein